MTTLEIALALAVVASLVWLVARLVVTLRHDGLGSARPPASHADWSDAVSDLPSHPYRSA